MGANSPEEYGNYYEWGETTTNTLYDFRYCKTYKKNLGDISGNPRYDVARANWGGTWRIPTSIEFHELRNLCIWTRTTQGCKVTGPNGNSIFLPFTGARDSKSIEAQGVAGNYWASTPDSNIARAKRFIVGDNYCMPTVGERQDGYSIRPVSD